MRSASIQMLFVVGLEVQGVCTQCVTIVLAGFLRYIDSTQLSIIWLKYVYKTAFMLRLTISA
jgi:hypothetical protein